MWSLENFAMSKFGVMKFAVNNTVFAKYNINPPWERMHTIILWIYVAFLVTFGITSVTDNPSCLPMNGTSGNNTSNLTNAEAKFVSDYCEEFADNEDPNVTLIVVLASLLYQTVFSSICLGLGMADTFSTFSKAEMMFSRLPETKKSGKSLFQEILHDPNSKNLRDIAEVLWVHEPGKAVLSMVSREVTLFVGTIGNAVAIWYWVETTPASPIFQCETDLEFGWSSGNLTEFTCMRHWVEERTNLVWFYVAVVMVHVTMRFLSLTAKFVFLARVKPHPNVASAKGFLLINCLWMASRTESESKFGEFVMAALTDEASNGMEIHIQSIGTDADPLISKFVPGSPPSKPDLDRLARERRWKWVKYLLDKRFEDFNVPEVLSDSTPDENGNSLLYYALNKTSGEHFSIHTAKMVLRHSTTVICGGVKMSAEEFVEDQSVNDSTYPQSLKDRLIMAIGENRKTLGRSDQNLIDMEGPSSS